MSAVPSNSRVLFRTAMAPDRHSKVVRAEFSGLHDFDTSQPPNSRGVRTCQTRAGGGLKALKTAFNSGASPSRPRGGLRPLDPRRLRGAPTPPQRLVFSPSSFSSPPFAPFFPLRARRAVAPADACVRGCDSTVCEREQEPREEVGPGGSLASYTRVERVQGVGLHPLQRLVHPGYPWVHLGRPWGVVVLNLGQGVSRGFTGGYPWGAGVRGCSWVHSTRRRTRVGFGYRWVACPG